MAQYISTKWRKVMDKIVYKNLSEEKRKSLKGVYNNIDKIWEFSCKANQSLFVYIFGEHMGNHYWDKFTREHHRDFLHFLRGLDSEVKGDLFANIFLNENLYANC